MGKDTTLVLNFDIEIIGGAAKTKRIFTLLFTSLYHFVGVRVWEVYISSLVYYYYFGYIIWFDLFKQFIDYITSYSNWLFSFLLCVIRIWVRKKKWWLWRRRMKGLVVGRSFLGESYTDMILLTWNLVPGPILTPIPLRLLIFMPYS